ncbi:oxidoreductase [Aureococcus anophagefferens]|nr:oxidoreductase [Aureococcus anophagefferens]
MYGPRPRPPWATGSIGGRHIDGANDYRTQVEIGEAVAAPTAMSLFITTGPGALGMQATIQCHEDNLQMLGQYGVNTSGYVTLKWSLQRGVAVVTGTDNKDHMASDLDLFGFALGDDEVAAISALQ